MKRPHRGIYRYYCYYRWICLSHFLRAGLSQLNLARLCSKGVLGNSVIQSYRERRRLPIPISEIFGPPSPTSILLYPLFCLKGKKLAQIALVGPGIRPQNSQRDDFTREPQCLLQSMFVFFFSTKTPLNLVFFQRLAFTHIPA